MIIKLVIIILSTSLLSGVFGTGGGLILMGIFTLILPIHTALFLHGIIQSFSNFFRATLNYHSIYWTIIPSYIAGSTISYLVLSIMLFLPSKKFIMIFIGLTPFLYIIFSSRLKFNIANRITAFICGLLVTFIQLVAGTTGPLFDTFLLGTKLNRNQIIATKAITQTISHLIKVLFYLPIISSNQNSELFSAQFLIIAIFSCFIGSKIGAKILSLITEEQFRSYSKLLLVIIGAVHLFRGLNF